MSSAQDIQTLLRFLSQDAKIPLAQAMGKVKELQAANLTTLAEIAKSNIEAIKAVFVDDKAAKQVLNAAKRASKKRSSASISDASAVPAKKAKSSYGEPLTPAQVEDSLSLPEPCRDEGLLKTAAVRTNRAPLVLAFGVTLLKYTMPEQPLSSRLSLAQAFVSANSKAKAVNIGLESGKSAEEEGWGEGQPIVKVMGRDIRVMKRWGYTWDVKEEVGLTQETMKEGSINTEEPALWGVNLERLKQSNGPVTAGSRSSSQLPIYTPQSARAHLLNSFDTPKSTSAEKSGSAKKGAAMVAEKERNLCLLLGALELLFESWSSILSKDELDNLAWVWYVRVRPEVEAGVAGWGERGAVKMSDILELRLPAV